MLDERESGSPQIQIKTNREKQANFDVIKPLKYEDMNVGSQVDSETHKGGHNLTQYDREKLQLKIEEMKREINEHNNLMGADEEDEDDPENN